MVNSGLGSQGAGPGGRPRDQVVYLHLGTPKSGTTYLQNVMWHNRARLREQGVLYPGDAYPAHYWATLDLQDAAYLGHNYPEVPGAWERLVNEARQWRGTTVISHELLTRSTPEQVKQALAALDFAEVHLVLTVRDLVRQIPAAWQETVKNRFGVSFTAFVEQLQNPEESKGNHGRAFWLMQDLVGILDRWAADLPADRVHIVTVPAGGGPQDLLWRRFAEVIGADPDQAPPPPVEANTSLGASETAFLRRLNRLVKEQLDWPVYERLVKHDMVPKLLGGREGARRIALSGRELEWAVERSASMLAEVAGRGHRIVGDLDEVTPGPPEGDQDRHPDDVTTDELLDVALDATRGLLVTAAERAERIRTLEERVREAEREAEEARRQVAVAREELRVAYERPVLRHLAHRIGQRVPPLLKLMEALVRVRDRLRRRRAAGGGRS